jgi:hypothetical protein
MTNEIATRNTTELDVSAPAIMGAPASGSIDLAVWAQEMQAAAILGETLCKTDFVPKDFRGKPEAATAAILAGKSLGMDPLSALQNIFVIHGRPGLYARTMHALVIAAGHEVVRTDASPTSVTVQARRKGEYEWQVFTWTMDRATVAGYVKSNAKYKENPIEMLTAKALSEACRVIAPDVLTGVAVYAVEELEDMGERPTRKPAAGIQALAAMAAAPEPASEPEAAAQDWYGLADAAQGEVATLQALYADAQASGADPDTLTYIRSQAKAS